MTDSIPQQAGPGAGADERAQFEAAMTRLESYSGTDFDRDSKGQYEFRSLRAYWFGWQARAHFSHLAAPLAVEDSRERCASSDADKARLDYLQRTGSTIDLPSAGQGLFRFRIGGLHAAVHHDLRAAIDAAMAAASSGKEKME